VINSGSIRAANVWHGSDNAARKDSFCTSHAEQERGEAIIKQSGRSRWAASERIGVYYYLRI
jgi:hypothetical protein